MSASEENLESKNVEDLVGRALWEPMHEYQSRLMFIEDNVARYGLEKAVRLSLVWANMNFLGCRYPDKTEEMVSFYPLPTQNEINSRKLRRPPRSGSNEQQNKSFPNAPGPIPSRQEVSDLISSIRSETELSVYPEIVRSIGNSLCLCVKCLGATDGEVAKAEKMLEKHTAKSSQPVEMSFKESPDGHTCVLVYKEESALTKTAATRKDAKVALCIELVRKVEDWQESHQLPACEHTMSQAQQPPHQGEYQQQRGYGGSSQQSQGGGYGGEYQQPSDYQRQGGHRQSSGYHAQESYRGGDYRGQDDYRSGGYSQGDGYRKPSDYRPPGGEYQQHQDYHQPREYNPRPRGHRPEQRSHGWPTFPASSYNPPSSSHPGGYVPPQHYNERGSYLMPPRPRGRY